MVNSLFASVKGEDNIVDYLNYFTLSYRDITERRGFAHSRFSSNGSWVENVPNTMTGSIALENEGILRTQYGERISAKEIREINKNE